MSTRTVTGQIGYLLGYAAALAFCLLVVVLLFKALVWAAML